MSDTATTARIVREALRQLEREACATGTINQAIGFGTAARHATNDQLVRLAKMLR